MNVLSGLYGRATELRRAWYGRHPHRARRLDRPVVSVGNLVVGGSGKTPLVAALARLLASAGERPAILSRGYRRRDAAAGVVVVSDGEQVLATPAQSGDEPFMLARALPGVPVLVSPDRYLAGRLAERRFACTVHVLDDGFQHLRLGRDIDLLVLSRADLDERVLPAGRLREPLTAARAAGALMVPGSDEDREAVRSRTGAEVVFGLRAHYQPLRELARADAVREDAGAPRAVVAVAGIARPQRFFDALAGLGYQVVRQITFRDHHWFSARDVTAIEQAAADARCGLIVTTEKDAVRLDAHVARAVPGSRGGSDNARSTVQWAVLPLELTIDPAERFASWLAGQLAAARRRRIEAAA